MVFKLTTEKLMDAIVSIETVNFSKMAYLSKKEGKKYFVSKRALPVKASPPKQHQQQQLHIVL